MCESFSSRLVLLELVVPLEEVEGELHALVLVLLPVDPGTSLHPPRRVAFRTARNLSKSSLGTIVSGSSKSSSSSSSMFSSLFLFLDVVEDAEVREEEVGEEVT